MWLIVIGVLFLGAAAVLYLRQNPEALDRLSARSNRGRAVGEATLGGNLEMESELAMEQRLERIDTGQFVVHLGSSLQVVATITLSELQKFGGPKGSWRPTGRKLKLVELAGDRLIAHMPRGEGEQPQWFMMQRGAARGLTQFMAGTKQKPGPARRFAASDQLGDSQFDWADADWKMTDIGTFDFQARGDGFLSGSGRCRHTMAEEVGGNRWFLFFDLMQGSGSDTLWIGQLIDPEVDIEDIL
ncbi:MAG: hypothetical protein WBB22_09320 [Anaerolineae bacterium]